MTRTVLGVWAHPDDEAYLCAGFLAAARAAGSRVVVATATRGEAGLTDPEAARVRAGELRESLAAIGVTEHRWLHAGVPLTDGSLAAVPAEVGAAAVAAVVDDVRPDLVLTFGPDGMTGHEAHKDVCRWATDAFDAAGKPGTRLLYATQKPAFLVEMVPQLERFNIFKPGSPPVTPDDELAIDFTCDADLLALKTKSLEAHESQIEGLLEVFGEEGLQRFIRDESYRDPGRRPGDEEA